MDSVNNRFKEVRKRLGFNQKDFASELGISQTHVSSIENGKDNPSTSLLKLLSIKFNIDEEWLISGVGSPDPGWDIGTDQGVIEKYNAIRVQFEHTLRNRTREDLLHTVEAFAYLDALLSPKKLTDEDKSKYLASICATIDLLEKLVFKAYNDAVHPSKGNTKAWLRFRNECDTELRVITEHIKAAVNLYLAGYGDEMKL